jgi:hypothetical protein
MAATHPTTPFPPLTPTRRRWPLWRTLWALALGTLLLASVLLVLLLGQLPLQVQIDGDSVHALIDGPGWFSAQAGQHSGLAWVPVLVLALLLVLPLLLGGLLSVGVVLMVVLAVAIGLPLLLLGLALALPLLLLLSPVLLLWWLLS